ncbi:AIPR family protein [Staphylococcus aureus]|uniref:AIPR family protein n=1 Tax=Staphylococcus aureus TaxID=1280 RepID=UPI00215D32B6|nr:AIPR family protein [Staphylococcus aureus]UVJ31353.1 AIPR family protein [Staphylococcus aureus]
MNLKFKAKEKDYDLIEKISKKYGEKLSIKKKDLSDKEVARLGFYHLGINLVLGLHDTNEISEKIIDTSYCSLVKGEKNNDLGIDAVHIDREEKKVELFSFKYRDKLNNGNTRSPDELKATTAFLGHLKRKETFRDSIDTKITSDIIYDIIDLQSKESDLDFNLYMIANDNAYFDKEDSSIKEFKYTYPWLEVQEINLSDIAEFVSLKAEPNEASIILNKKELLQHDMDGYTTANSYVAKVKLIDLIKITSKEYDLRKEDSIDEIETVKRQEIDLNVLFDNVRGYLGKTGHNQKIINTLKEEPEKFFLFNNGLTITAKDIIVKAIKMHENYRIELKEYQIVNGGQTLRSIYSFKDNNPGMIINLARSSVLVRFFKTGLEEGLVNKVSEYTNSQNAISGRDLKSVDKIQLDIERRFDEEDINYIRKVNKVDKFEKEYKYKISMEKLGQLLLAFKGHPEKVSNNKKKIFDDYYNYLFNDDNSFMNHAISLVKEYHQVINEYKKKSDKYKFYEQKTFYIIYLNKFLKQNSLSDNIEMFENLMSNYRKDEEHTPPRKLLQKKFKELVDIKIEEITNEKPTIQNITKNKKK